MSKTIELKDSQTITLERKIAAALDASDITSADLLSLIDETTAAIDAADVTAKSERARALDLTQSPDAHQARETLQASEFAAARLRSTLPRLQQSYEDIAAQEYLTAWQADFAALKETRDALATEFREVYSPCVSKIVDVLTRIAALDIEVSRLHQGRPSGVALHLESAELVARGLEAFSRDNPSIAKELQLPHFENSGRMAWPPPAPSLATLMPPPVRGHLGANWWQESDARTAARLEESKQLATYYENQQRAREGMS